MLPARIEAVERHLPNVPMTFDKCQLVAHASHVSILTQRSGRTRDHEPRAAPSVARRWPDARNGSPAGVHGASDSELLDSAKYAGMRCREIGKLAVSVLRFRPGLPKE